MGELRGGVLLCRYASHWAQINGLAEDSRDRADLTRQVIEGGFCIEAEAGAVVEVDGNAAEALAPGIVEPDSVYMVTFPEDRVVKSAVITPGWWIAREAVVVRS